MRNRVIFKGLAVTILLIAAAAPVGAALEGHMDYSTQTAASGVDVSAVTGSIDTSVPECGPVYMPTIVRERDGSIVGVAYVLDGDDC
jgi:hypothetical protein